MYRSNILASIKLARQLKGKIIIFGGPGIFPKRISKFVKSTANFQVPCEGDVLLGEILQKIENPGYEIKEAVFDINLEPTPDFDDLNPRSFSHLPYSTTRGCFNRCKYCNDRVFWKEFRVKSIVKITDDLQALSERYGVSHFLFADSNMVGSKKRLKELSRELESRGLKLKWEGQIDVSLIDRETLKIMKRAGCVKISVGIESGSDKVLQRMGRTYIASEAQQRIRDAKGIGMKVTALFIAGYTGENWLDFMRTLSFIKRNRKFIDDAYCSPYSYEGQGFGVTRYVRWLILQAIIAPIHFANRKID